MNTQIQRREFFHKATMLAAGLLVLSENTMADMAEMTLKENQIPLLNPAFRINRMDNGNLELFTFQPDHSRLSHIFSGLEADILIEIDNHNHPLSNVDSLADRYNLTEKKCKKKIKESLNELENSGIVYYGEPMLVKISEK